MIGAYIVGVPGAGKSTALRELTARVPVEWRRKPFAHAVYYSEGGRPLATQIGGLHERFPGTDRLSMSVQPAAIEWVQGAPAPVVFGEGDRLATNGFLSALDDACTDWWLIQLVVPPEVAEQRRAARGSNQDPKWLEGRRTKVRKLVEANLERVVRIDADCPREAVVAQLRALEVFAWTANGD